MKEKTEYGLINTNRRKLQRWNKTANKEKIGHTRAMGTFSLPAAAADSAAKTYSQT
jgi:hypothetical protein